MEVVDDDDLDDWGVAFETTKEKPKEPEKMPDFKAEFDKVWPEWVRHARTINWMAQFKEDLKEFEPNHKFKAVDLLNLNISKLYREIADDKKFGFLPNLARASRGSIATLPAESLCERIISAANLVMTDGNTLLGDEELDMLVTLRMNREFIEWARQKYAHLLSKSFNTDEIPLKENENSEE